MKSVEAGGAMFAQKLETYKVIRGFIDSPPPGFNVVFDPSAIEEDRPIESRHRLLMAIGVGLTVGDNWEIDSLGMDWYNSRNAQEERGILLRARADVGVVATSGLDARFFNPEDPTELKEPMKSFSLLPSGLMARISSEGMQGYNTDSRFEGKAAAIMGLIARAVSENRLVAPDIYWIQKITGKTFPPGISPFPARR